MSRLHFDTYYLIHLSRLEATEADVIVATLLASGAGYLLIRLLMAKGPRGLLSSVDFRSSPAQLGIAVLVGICATFVVRLILTGRLTGLRIQEPRPGVLFALLLLGGVAMQPFVEEVYFRGILFAGLSDKLGPWVSICFVTLAFALLHGGHWRVVLPISIGLGIIRVLTGSTANSFAMHAAYNLGVMLWGIR